MRLHNLVKSGGFKKRKRVGRGEGGGLGKTSGRGHKGQRARAGHSLRPGFESGHVPLYRKLPKRGFSNFRFRREYAIVNVGDLERVAGDTVDKDSLVAAGLVRRSAGLVKILGVGEVSRALTVTADKLSATAKEKIEKAGGKVIVPEVSAEQTPAADAE
ncbi:MAG: 50S ribosomal protein L15 [Opitutales bacterium]|nr:50S ribosomal protein L15 [Opitutales bacterium]